MQKGDLREARASAYYHKKGVPLLLSSLVLREVGCGQCDIAYFESPQKIVLVEVKGAFVPSSRQLKRLKRTAHFVAQIFRQEISLRIHQNKSLPK